MYDEINSYDPDKGFGLENTPEARANFLKKYELANTDWFDLLFNNSLAQEHSVKYFPVVMRNLRFMFLPVTIMMKDGLLIQE